MLEWYYLAIASGALLSITTLMEKHLLKAEHATSFTAVTTIAIFLISLLLLPLVNFGISAYQYLLIFIASVGFIGSTLFVARLYRHGDVSSVTPITSTLPILVLTVTAFIFLGEALSLQQYVGIIIIVIATYLILSDTRKATPVAFLRKNIQYFILAALFYALGATILKYELFGISPYTFLVISEIFMSAIILAYVFLRFDTFRYLARDVKAYKKEIVIFSAANIGYTLLYYLAATAGSISIVYTMRAGVSIVLAVLGSALIFKERVNKRLPLAIVIIAALYLLL